MKKKNVFWGVLFLLGACAVIAGRLGFLDGIGFWSILFSLVLAAVLIRGIVSQRPASGNRGADSLARSGRGVSRHHWPESSVSPAWLEKCRLAPDRHEKRGGRLFRYGKYAI